MHARRDRSEAGFTLLQLIIVVTVIAVLAGIAIPIYLGQRRSAVDASLKADLSSTADAEESYVAATGNHVFGTTNVAELLKNGASYTRKNVVDVALGSNGYCIRGSAPHSSATGSSSKGYFYYDSKLGGLLPHAMTTPPPNGSCVAVESGEWVNIADGDGGEFIAAADAQNLNPTASPSATPTAAPTSAPPVTPVVPVNDVCGTALSLAMPANDAGTTTTGDVTNVNATDDSYGTANVYWQSTNLPGIVLTVKVNNPVGAGDLQGYRTLGIYKGPTTASGQACNGNLTQIASVTAIRPSAAFSTENCGCSYYYVVSGTPAQFRLAVTRHG